MTKDLFLKSILPIGFLFSGSLILSNTAYLYLSVSYIQMLKVSLVFFALCILRWLASLDTAPSSIPFHLCSICRRIRVALLSVLPYQHAVHSALVSTCVRHTIMKHGLARCHFTLSRC